MDTILNDRLLSGYVMDVLDSNERDLVEKQLERTPELRSRLNAFEQGLGGDVVAPDTVSAWTGIKETITKRSSVSSARLLKPQGRRLFIPYAVAASLLIMFVAWRLLLIQTIPFWQGSPSGDGIAYRALSAAGKLQPGSSIRLDAGKTISLSMKDKARLQLTGPANIRMTAAAEGVSGWFLSKGLLKLDIKRKTFRSFMVNTPHGGVVVVGTAFSIDVSEKETLVKVKRGRVRVFSQKKGESLDITSGEAIRCLPAGLKPVVKESVKNPIRQGLPRRTGFVEKIYLHNGTIFSGKIISQDKVKIQIKTKHGIFNINRSKIRNVSYK